MPIKSSIDANRLAAIASRPGIDPRVWLTFGVVQDVAYDAEHGMLADVQYMPEGDIETALVGSCYLGHNYGAWCGLKKGHIVLIAVPLGDPSAGPVIISQIHTGSERPPEDFKNESSSDPMDPTINPTIRVEDGATLRVIAKNGAKISLEVSSDSEINLKATGTGNIAITGEAKITVDSPNIVLGKGGKPVATVGDLVAVTVPLMVAGTVPVTTVVPSLTTPFVGYKATGQVISGRQNIQGG